MGTKLGYDLEMKRLLSRLAAVLTFFILVPVLSAQNQSRGASAPGASSMRSSFRVPAGPTFVPRLGIRPGFRSPTPCCGTFSGGFTFGVGSPRNPFYPPNFGHHHRGGFNNFGGVIAVPYAVPVYPYPYYGYDTNYQDSEEAQSADEAQQEAPAPTIFENRSRRAIAQEPVPANSYVSSQETPSAVTSEAATPQPHAPEQTSVLIFRDGHQLEVQNYAIVGDTLYDLTPGHSRKISLAKIDVPATVEANDDRGIAFRVPVQN